MYKTEISCTKRTAVLYNHLNSHEKRTIETCNFNQHIRSRHPNRIMKMHDLVFIREGNWQIFQDSIEYTVNAGDVILLQSGHHHYGITPCEPAVKTCYIHFSSDPGDFVTEEQPEGIGFYSFPIVVHCGKDSSVERYFERVIRAFWSDEPYENAKASACLDLLLCEISSMGRKSITIADEIKSLIRQTPHRFLSNEELAGQLGCSVRTISGKFRESTGVGIHAWQMELKCRMADELIQHEPTVTLKEVAATYGFYDEYHFGKCFKKVMGRSPKKGK